MRYFLNFLLVVAPIFCHAQIGHYYLSHYSPTDERVDRVAYDMAQGQDGVLYFATRSGVLSYDGRNWELVNEHTAIYSLEVGRGDVIYWGGATGFGKLARHQDGTLKMIRLSESTNDVYQTLCVESDTYFLTDKAIYRVRADSVTSIPASDLSGSFSFLFEIAGRPYVSTDKSTSFELQDKGLQVATFASEYELEITFSAKFESEYLVGTIDSRLFLSSGRHLTEIDLKEDSYINASVIIGGTWINDKLVALATLRGGVIFLNPRTGRIEEIINYQMGLPDNETLSLMRDRDNNIWVAHEYGFTRIEPFLPFRSFSRYSGLSGNLLCAKNFEDNVYVGTSLGLYKLTREEVFDEITYYDDVLIEVKAGAKAGTTAVPDTTEVVNVPVSTQGEKEKRGFLRFLKRKRDNVQDIKVGSTEPVNSSNENRVTDSSSPKSRFITEKVKRTERLLRSADYVFKKVEGIDSKISHMVVSDGKLVAAGLEGVFEIEDQQAVPILEEPVRSIYNSKKDVLFISTYSDRVRTIARANGTWTRQHYLDDLTDQITYVFEESHNSLWLCGLDDVYNLEFEGTSIAKITNLDLTNPNFSKTLGVIIEGKPMFVNESGFYTVDNQRTNLTRIDSLGAADAYFVTAGNLLYRKGHAWAHLGMDVSHDNIQMLNIPGNIRFMAANGDESNLWIITGDNELYKFYSDRLALTTGKYPVFLKSVRLNGERMPLTDKIKLVQDEGELSFEVVQPAFTRTEAVEYRYRLVGLTNEWTEWSMNNNKIDFHFLPLGTYTLQLEAKDAFGNVTELQPQVFVVQPPFWKRPWFYAMEFSLFSLLVMLSFKLSIRYQFVSRLLTMLTIILLIEFIQTIAGSTFTTDSSPIIDFVIQVVVAFLILPVEGYLRDLMFRSMGSGSRLYDVINELNKTTKKK